MDRDDPAGEPARAAADAADAAPRPGFWRRVGRFALAALAGVGAATAGLEVDPPDRP